jgi:hypothetical protein
MRSRVYRQCSAKKKLPDALLVEATYFEEVRSKLASHTVAKVTPKSGISRYHKLIRFRWHFFTLQRVHDMGII